MVKALMMMMTSSLFLMLIDWEQSGALASTLAPEADGIWDFKEQHGTDELVYAKYIEPRI